VVLFGATAAGSAWSQDYHGKAQADQPEPKEELCQVQAIYEIRVSEDGKSLEVYNEAEELVSNLTVAQLAGLNGKPRRFMLSDNCMTNSDKALMDLIKANPAKKKVVEEDQEQVQKPEEKKDLLEKFLVYSGSSGKIDGLKFYEFDQKRRNHKAAIDFCAAKGLRLMTLDEAKDLEKELESDKSKLAKWLGGKERSWTWTSSDSSDDPDYARYLYAGDIGNVYVSINGRDYGYGVRCVVQ